MIYRLLFFCKCLLFLKVYSPCQSAKHERKRRGARRKGGRITTPDEEFEKLCQAYQILDYNPRCLSYYASRAHDQGLINCKQNRRCLRLACFGPDLPGRKVRYQ